MRCITIREQTDVSEARRGAQAAAQALGFDETAAGRAALVATELATNVLRHGGGGELLIGERNEALELIALDRGPGMADVEACLRDGYSTGGTRGEGLGAVARQAEAFELYSRPGLGTAVLARIAAKAGARLPDLAYGGLSLPYPGETVCGDAWSARPENGGLSVMVADGLGHGLLAAEAAGAAVAAFERRPGGPPATLLEQAHGMLRPTRGAAVAIARLEPDAVSFAGVGNIAGVVVGAQGSRKMISHNGTLGHVARRFQAFDYPAEPPWLVVMHSDGIGSSWSLDRYPGLAARDPCLVAAVIYRDFARGRDDATVVVARGPGGAP